jgi:hypothetical protein
MRDIVLELETDEAALEAFAKYIYRDCYSDSKPEFKMVFNDPEKDTYDIMAKTFVEADRAGFSDYVTTKIFRKLDRATAIRIIELLEGAGKK